MTLRSAVGTTSTDGGTPTTALRCLEQVEVVGGHRPGQPHRQRPVDVQAGPAQHGVTAGEVEHLGAPRGVLAGEDAGMGSGVEGPRAGDPLDQGARDPSPQCCPTIGERSVRIPARSAHQSWRRVGSLDRRNGGRADKCTRLESGRPTRPGGSNPSRSACWSFCCLLTSPVFTKYLVDVPGRVSAFIGVPGALLSSLLSSARLLCLAEATRRSGRCRASRPANGCDARTARSSS